MSKFPTPPVEQLSLDFCHTLFYKTLCSSLFISHFLESFFVFFDRKMNSIRSFALPILGFFVMALFQISHGQGLAPSPSPNAPTSDGSAIDQGIAYVLLVLALAITYLVH